MRDAKAGLLPDLDVTRRGFVMTSLATGFALATQPVSAQTIATDTQGLTAGEVKIPVTDGEIPAYRAFARDRRAVSLLCSWCRRFSVSTSTSRTSAAGSRSWDIWLSRQKCMHARETFPRSRISARSSRKSSRRFPTLRSCQISTQPSPTPREPARPTSVDKRLPSRDSAGGPDRVAYSSSANPNLEGRRGLVRSLGGKMRRTSPQISDRCCGCNQGAGARALRRSRSGNSGRVS